MNDEDVRNIAAASHATSPSSATSTSAARPTRKAYAGSSGRELSTSAAKRQSVMALGSIKHLQHMYAKTGLASNSPLRLGASGQALPLALPGQVPSEQDELELDDNDFPPSPSPPAQLAEKSFEVHIPSSRLQKEAVYRELSEVCEKWGLVEMERSIVPSSRRDSSTGSTTSSVSNAYDRSTTASPTPSEYHDQSLVLTLMSTTTAAIRAAQKYFLSLPADKLSGVSELSNMPTGGPAKSPSGGPPVLGVSTASRPIPRQSTMGIASPNRSATSPEGLRSATNQSRGSAKDPLLRLRKASLATLGSLKEMGHRYRLLPSKQDSDMKDVEESLGDLSITSSASSIANPSFQIEDTSVSEQSGESDSRKGHLYRTDVSLRDLNQEAQVVKEWVETVNDLLTHVSSESKTSRVRTRSGNLSSDNSPLPNWARSDAYGGDRLSQVIACLDAHLPKDLREELHRAGEDDDILYCLADGQMLCIAYNAVLRKSQRPWGFIPHSSIHDVISLTQECQKIEQAQLRDESFLGDSSHLSVRGSSALMRRASSEGLSGDDSTINGPNSHNKRIGLTFRRFENLRVFVAALKLRYLIQVRPDVNIKTIARKEQGWRDMLLDIAFSWIEAAAEEKRNEEVESD